MSELLTVPEAAEQIRVSRRTVERFIAAGQIRTHKIGRRTFISQAEIDAFVAGTRRRSVA